MKGLPAGWAELSLFEACTKITDGTHHSPPNKATGDFRYVTAKNIKRHGLDLTDLTYVSAEVHRGIYERCPVEQGDILYIKDGATTGLAINNPLEEPFSLLSSVALLKPDRRVLDERYLRHWLNSPDTLASMIGQMSGSAIKRLTLTTISGQRLPLPPLAEQRRIVAKLDALTARTARARADLDRIPALAARYKQVVLAKAFSGELTAEWRGEAEFSPEPGVLPHGWNWNELQSLASDEPRSIQSGPFGSNLRHSEFQREGRLVIGIDNVQDGRFSVGSNHRISQRKFEELEKYRARPGDVAITVMATVGRTCVIPDDIEPATITKHIYRITLDREVADPYFVMNALRGAETVLAQMGANMRGQTRPGINGSILKTLNIPTAPLYEQIEIVRRIDRAFAEIDRLVAEAAAARRLIDRLDQAVLAKAFRGELVPQDPADEPASVLLNRIRAERAAAPKAKRARKAVSA